MNQDRIKKLIHEGEGISIEFKECRNKLNKTVFLKDTPAARGMVNAVSHLVKAEEHVDETK